MCDLSFFNTYNWDLDEKDYILYDDFEITQGGVRTPQVIL